MSINELKEIGVCAEAECFSCGGPIRVSVDCTGAPAWVCAAPCGERIRPMSDEVESNPEHLAFKDKQAAAVRRYVDCHQLIEKVRPMPAGDYVMEIPGTIRTDVLDRLRSAWKEGMPGHQCTIIERGITIRPATKADLNAPKLAKKR